MVALEVVKKGVVSCATRNFLRCKILCVDMSWAVARATLAEKSKLICACNFFHTVQRQTVGSVGSLDQL